jgi:hypothetical protein
MASISMPIPDTLKNHVSPEKINAYSLSIVPGTCDAGVNGTKIEKTAVKLEVTGATLANEKLRQGCSYTLTLSLGKADSAFTKLEKIYLTNDFDQKRTQISIEETRAARIKIVALLSVTSDGKTDLGFNQPSFPVPSGSESDVDISVDIDRNSRSSSGWGMSKKKTADGIVLESFKSGVGILGFQPNDLITRIELLDASGAVVQTADKADSIDEALVKVELNQKQSANFYLSTPRLVLFRDAATGSFGVSYRTRGNDIVFTEIKKDSAAEALGLFVGSVLKDTSSEAMITAVSNASGRATLELPGVVTRIIKLKR